ncbi:MAG TPA: hypothetical protein VFL81_00705 [Candidatus Saccharimonadales bacterium]|nr:hypothetical protein [Candidatus Saccharimonadales bacterium]
MEARRLILPGDIVGRADVTKVLRELESVNDFMLQADLRHVAVRLPAISRQLNSLAEANQYDLSDKRQRLQLITFLNKIRSLAPQIHLSLASEPSETATAKIIDWLRRELSSYTMLEIGIQPSMVAGCRIRTTNKLFDFSLHRQLASAEPALRQKIGEL